MYPWQQTNSMDLLVFYMMPAGELIHEDIKHSRCIGGKTPLAFQMARPEYQVFKRRNNSKMIRQKKFLYSLEQKCDKDPAGLPRVREWIPLSCNQQLDGFPF
jgi:hypothetical protein